MKRTTIKKIAIISSSVVVGLALILCIHIYMAVHKHDGEPQRVMARVDIEQDITDDDATKITALLYQQKGVDHVLCNAGANIAVFTFAPGANSADNIIGALQSTYKGKRYLPSQQDMMKGCPIAAGSWTDKVYRFFRSI